MHVKTNRSSQRAAAAALVVALAAITCQRARAVDPQFKLLDLGLVGHQPAGYYFANPATSAATGINDAGQISINVTWHDNSYAEEPHAMIYAKGSLTDIANPGDTRTQTAGINSSGQIAGYYTLPNAQVHMGVYTPGAGWSDRWPQVNASVANLVHTFATGINDAGQLSAWTDSYPPGQEYHAIRSDSGGGVTNLGLLPGGTDAFAYGINATGQVVGKADVPGGTTHAFIAKGGAMNDLTPGATNISTALAVNADGIAVGDAYDGNSNEHAVLWQNGTMTDLGSLKDYNGNVSTGDRLAEAINADGFVVGRSNVLTRQSREDRAFLYYDGHMLDLNGLVTNLGQNKLSDAQAINSAGQIVVRDETTNALVLLTPVTSDLRARGAGVSATILGGSRQSGGVTLTAPAGSTGTLRGDFAQADPSAALPFGAGPVTFGLPTDTVQLWDLSFTGSTTGPLSVSLGYDDSLLHAGVSESDLALYHYTGGQWVRVPATVDAANNTIAFTPDGFSPYALGTVPEPTGLAVGLLTCGWLGSRRRKGRD